jgi:hypothetical protein
MALIVKFRVGEFADGDFKYHDAGTVKLKDGKIVMEDDDGKMQGILEEEAVGEDGKRYKAADGFKFLTALPYEYSGIYFNARFDEDDAPDHPEELK